MTLETFLIKLGGVAFNILLILAYLGIRILMKGKKYLWSATNQEYDALRDGEVTVEDLANGVWSVNIAKVTSYASFGLGTVVLAAIFIFEQQQDFTGYDSLFFYILLSVVALSMICYFLSLQLWFLVMDVGGTVNTKIMYRGQATFFQVVGWYAIHVAILLSILTVNTVAGYFFSVVNMAAAVYLIELKAIASLREQYDASGMNEFQKSLDLDTIYVKNEDAELQTYDDQKLRIVTWNIERGFEPDKLAEYILSVDPHIVALQEVDWGNERTDNLDVLEYIAQKTGMRGYFGIEFFEIESPYRDEKQAGGGVHGNAILTRVEPEDVYRVELPRILDWENPPPEREKRVRKEKRIGGRFSLCADFVGAASTLTVCSTHFEDKLGGPDGRVTQVNDLIESLDARTPDDGVQIIAGDMNTLANWLTHLFGITKAHEAQEKPWRMPECVWWKTSIIPGTEYQDPFTCSDWTFKLTRLYREKLDWLLVRNAAVTDKGVGDFNSSDHRPLWIELIPQPVNRDGE
jgi:endonuclease/exonuclease/phosphatase family metal-dependent hydrolase